MDSMRNKKSSINKIQEATQYGEKLIYRILNVEKSQTNQHKLNLENFDIVAFIGSIADSFRLKALKKNIQLHINTSGIIYVMSDKELIGRICENLLSNAVKFTPRGKNIFLTIAQEDKNVKIIVQDQGVGIQKDELPNLFSKYSKISSQSTDGEPSTGLGLAIVKRIVDELNGSIFCQSEPAIGSTFTVILEK